MQLSSLDCSNIIATLDIETLRQPVAAAPAAAAAAKVPDNPADQKENRPGDGDGVPAVPKKSVPPKSAT